MLLALTLISIDIQTYAQGTTETKETKVIEEPITKEPTDNKDTKETKDNKETKNTKETKTEPEAVTKEPKSVQEPGTKGDESIQEPGTKGGENVQEPGMKLQPVTVKELGITDEDAKNQIIKRHGEDLAKHMQLRVKGPLSSEPQQKNSKFSEIRFSKPATDKKANNFSGYISDIPKGTLLGAEGRFNVPQVTNDGLLSAWVGVADATPDQPKVVQAGVEFSSYRQAWVEFFPGEPLWVPAEFSINPGDSIYIDVAQDTMSGAWTILIINETTKKWYCDGFSTDVKFDAKQACWILEVPTAKDQTGQFISPPPTHADITHFTKAGWEKGQSYTVSRINDDSIEALYRFSLTDKHDSILFSPSNINPDGMSFDVNTSIK